VPQILIGLFILLSSPILFSFWWGHLLTVIYVSFHIHKLAKYPLFWILLLSCIFFSSEPRFSVEYFLIASGLFSVSLSDSWKSFKIDKKEIFFVVLFVLFFSLDFFKIRFFEKGSLLLLLPFTLSFLFGLAKLHIKNPRANRKKLLVYALSSIAILLSNKRTTLLAFITSLKQAFSKKILFLLAIVILASSFLIKDSLVRHYQKSVEPRLYIWTSATKGFLDKPIFGHGFGTFALDFPPYRHHADIVGGENTEYINHGHSQVFHTLFENGLLGIACLAFLAFFIFKHNQVAFYTFLVTLLLDVPLKSFGQFLTFGLILNTLNFRVTGKYESLFLKKISRDLVKKILSVCLLVICCFIFSISSIAHFYFDLGQIDKAIEIDKYNSLYHFERGAFLINQDIEQSEIDLENAIKISPDIGYMQAFYSAALLGNGKTEKAKIYIDKALEQMGDDAYLHALAAFIHHDDKELSEAHMEKALVLNPDIEELLKDPSMTADEFIAARHSNPRIMSFYRRGKKLFLPLPYIE